MTLWCKRQAAWLQGMEPSVWGQDKLQPRYPKLAAGQEVQGDVVVIGAGLTGLSTAYNLAKAGGQGRACPAPAGATHSSTHQAPACVVWGRVCAGLAGSSSASHALAARQSKAFTSAGPMCLSTADVLARSRWSDRLRRSCTSAQYQTWSEGGGPQRLLQAGFSLGLPQGAS